MKNLILETITAIGLAAVFWALVFSALLEAAR